MFSTNAAAETSAGGRGETLQTEKKGACATSNEGFIVYMMPIQINIPNKCLQFGLLRKECATKSAEE